jgi:hypothetical protein
MTIRAVVRVMPDEHPGAGLNEPSAEKLQATVSVLARLGFSRVRPISFGVSFAGQSQDFKRVFNIELRDGQVFGKDIRPVGELANLVDRLEVAPTATLCA